VQGKFPRAVLATKIDDRELCEIAIAGISRRDFGNPG